MYKMRKTINMAKSRSSIAIIFGLVVCSVALFYLWKQSTDKEGLEENKPPVKKQKYLKTTVLKKIKGLLVNATQNNHNSKAHVADKINEAVEFLNKYDYDAAKTEIKNAITITKEHEYTAKWLTDALNLLPKD